MQKFDHHFVFLRKNAILCRKLSKIAENCDHNIDPLIFFSQNIFFRGVPNVTQVEGKCLRGTLHRPGEYVRYTKAVPCVNS
jgi:hypothetical protein